MKNTSSADHVFQLTAPRKSAGRKSVCFAARLSGLYRSANSGRTWENAFASLNLVEPLAALSVACAPNYEHDPSVFAGLNGGILFSVDGGATWSPSRVPTPPPAVSTLVCSPNFAEDGIIFAATLEDGVLYSSDRGRRWVSWNFGLLDLNTFCLAVSPNFASDETLFVGTQSGIFRSTNGGRAWREVTLPIGFEAVLSLAISPHFAHDATLFAGTENHGLLQSTDGGQTWNRLGKSRFKNPVNAIVLAPDYSKYPALLVLHGGSFLFSADNGKTWVPWRKDTLIRKDATAILAPPGFDERVPALVGLEDGAITVV